VSFRDSTPIADPSWQVDLENFKFHYCVDPSKAEACLRVLDAYPIWYIDLETYCRPEWRTKVSKKAAALDPHTGDISILSIKVSDLPPVVLDVLVLEDRGFDFTILVNLLRTRTKLIAHKAQFEAKWLYKKFGYLGFNYGCTMILSKIFANATGSKFGKAKGHTLEDICRDLFSVRLSGKGVEQVSDWWPRPGSLIGLADSDNYDSLQDEQARAIWNKKLRYAAADVLPLEAIYSFYHSVLVAPLPETPLIKGDPSCPSYGLGQQKVIELEEQMITCSAMIEFNGIPVSRAILEGIQSALWNRSLNEGRIVELAGELCEDLGLEYHESFLSDLFVPTPESFRVLNNPVKLKEAIVAQTGVKLDTTQSRVITRMIDLLERIQSEDTESADDVGFIDQDEADAYSELLGIENSILVKNCRIAKRLLEYKRLSKLEGMNLAKFINPATNCIHSNLNQVDAATGRSTSSSPNQQNVPSRTRVSLSIEEGKEFVTDETIFL
jgi:hypothetical protein